MSKIPTTSEFIKEFCITHSFKMSKKSIKELMIEFAKLHVQEALKTALSEIPYGGSDEIRYEDVVHILDCYNLDNIK